MNCRGIMNPCSFRAYDNIENMDGDDTKKGTPPVQIEMLPVRGRD
jgi:hypothetical protein